MAQLVRFVRRAAIFILATFLWLHALFFLNIQSALIEKFARMMKFATSELVVFSILIIFSFLAASGFWRMLGSLAYIYFFPFVLSWYAFYFIISSLRSLDRWFRGQGVSPQNGSLVEVRSAAVAAALDPSKADHKPRAKYKLSDLFSFMTRPFRRFTILWCILLLVTTHSLVTWLCLILVLAQIGRKILRIVQILFFSDSLLTKISASLPAGLHKALSGLDSVKYDAAPSRELNQLWEQLKLYRKILAFLTDEYLLSRWAWVFGTALFGSIYVYMAVLFSFAYYGIARVNGVSYPWPNSLVASLFIPFFVSELPQVLAAKLLGGIHCTLVIAVGIGTVFNYLQRKLEAVRIAASQLSDRFAEETIREKYLMLEQKVFVVATSEPRQDGE